MPIQFYDPRVWVREGEKTLVTRVKEACADLGNVGKCRTMIASFAPIPRLLSQTDCDQD